MSKGDNKKIKNLGEFIDVQLTEYCVVIDDI